MCKAHVKSTCCVVSKINLFLVLLRTTKAVRLQTSVALGIMLVKALDTLNSFRLGFDNYNYNSYSKDL